MRIVRVHGAAYIRSLVRVDNPAPQCVDGQEGEARRYRAAAHAAYQRTVRRQCNGNRRGCLPRRLPQTISSPIRTYMIGDNRGTYSELALQPARTSSYIFSSMWTLGLRSSSRWSSLIATTFSVHSSSAFTTVPYDPDPNEPRTRSAPTLS